MDQNPYVKLKFNYQKYQNLLTDFNTQQKQGKYKPLPYNDYRLIAGKFFTDPISDVVIECVDVNNFIIVFFQLLLQFMLVRWMIILLAPLFIIILRRIKKKQ